MTIPPPVPPPAPLPPARTMRAPHRASQFRMVGLLLLVPAAIAAVVSLIVPTGQTIWKSFHRSTPLRGAQDKFVGLDNYGDVLGSDDFWRALGFSVLVVIIPLLVA